MEAIAKRFKLSLDDAWNKMPLPHRGRHPNDYHEFVLAGMKKAEKMAGKGNAQEFVRLFDKFVKTPVSKDPSMLRKAFWK